MTRFLDYTGEISLVLIALLGIGWVTLDHLVNGPQPVSVAEDFPSVALLPIPILRGEM